MMSSVWLTPYVLLALAIAAVWCPELRLRGYPLPAWVPLFLAAGATGLTTGALTWSGVGALAMLWALLAGSRRAAGPAQTAFLVIAAGLVLALAMHAVPGFNNRVVIDGVRFTSDAAPYTRYLNFDKGGAGLLILATIAQRIEHDQEWSVVLRNTAVFTLGTAAVVTTIALVIGYVDFAPKIPTGAATWAVTNLLFTCMPETCFFSAFVQAPLHCAVGGQRSLRWLPIAAASLAFGIAHIAGGPWHVLLATLAGAGYALAYATTRRVEAAILTHFGINAVHFFGFTYPYLQTFRSPL